MNAIVNVIETTWEMLALADWIQVMNDKQIVLITGDETWRVKSSNPICKK